MAPHRCDAINWYRAHDRLHSGDAITMAADTLKAYRTDTAAGKDALLICDTTEMADALNQRLHHDTVDADASASGSHHYPPQRPHHRAAQHQRPCG